MKFLKVLSIKEWVLSHVFIVGGLVLISVGLSLDAICYTIAGIWVSAFGVCLTFYSAFGKLATK